MITQQVLGRIGNIKAEDAGSYRKVTLGIAVNKKNRNGDEFTKWVNAVFFGKLAETVEKYFAKGDMIFASGDVDFWEYNGEKYESLKAHSFSFVGGSSNGDGDNKKSEPKQRQAPPQQRPDDDLPF